MCTGARSPGIALLGELGMVCEQEHPNVICQQMVKDWLGLLDGAGARMLTRTRS
jgi:hypothetical protein